MVAPVRLDKDIRKIVDDRGFAKAESILSEWNLTIAATPLRWALRSEASLRAELVIRQFGGGGFGVGKVHEPPRPTAAKNELGGRQSRLAFVRAVHVRLGLRHRPVDRDFRVNSGAPAWRRVNA